MNKKLLAKLVLIVSPFLIAYNIWTLATDRWSSHMDIAIVAATVFLVFAISILIRYRKLNKVEKD